MNAYWNPDLELSLNTRNFSTRNKRDFVNKKSTVRLLYRLLLQCKNLKLKKQLVTLISLDLEKGFDSVWINGLLWKLNHIGITGNILGLIESFLRNRQLYEEIGEYQSDDFKTDIGVPQGAVL